MSEEFANADWADGAFRQNNTGSLIILFHPVQKKMNKESLLQGRPIYQEVIHITKIVPGDQKLVIDRPVRETDKEEYADKWAHFERTRENKAPGFPIENWHALSETQKAEFKGMKVMTVEQFAGLSDGVLQNIMGGLDLRRKAQFFLEAGKDAELLAKVRSEADMKTAELEKKIADLTALVERMTAPEKVVA